MFVIRPDLGVAGNITKVLRRLRLYQTLFLKPGSETVNLSHGAKIQRLDGARNSGAGGLLGRRRWPGVCGCCRGLAGDVSGNGETLWRHGGGGFGTPGDADRNLSSTVWR